MRRRWKVYAAAGSLIGLYTLAGMVASWTVPVSIRLAAGEAATVFIPRLNAGPAQLVVRFDGYRPDLETLDGKLLSREELTRYSSDVAAYKARKAADFDLVVAVPDDQGSKFSPGPVRAFSPPHYWRSLGAEDGLSPTLFPGLNRLRLRVASADPPIAGEQVQINVLPALGVKSTEKAVAWLWWSTLSFYYLPAYVLVGIGMASLDLRRRSGNPPKALSPDGSAGGPLHRAAFQADRNTRLTAEMADWDATVGDGLGQKPGGGRN